VTVIIGFDEVGSADEDAVPQSSAPHDDWHRTRSGWPHGIAAIRMYEYTVANISISAPEKISPMRSSHHPDHEHQLGRSFD